MEKILAIDDDEILLKLLGNLLEPRGYNIKTCSQPEQALEIIQTFKPDLVILDVLMQGIDGFTLLKEIRDKTELKSIKIFILTAKFFEFDKLRAFELGADAFISKPFETEKLLEKVEQTLHDRSVLTFWGTRGSLPSPGPDTIKYGGNTSCVELRLPKEKLFILDAGTGIRKLGKKIARGGVNQKINILLTHPHWDHIFGLPFFIPIYKPGNEIVICGARHGNISLREVVAGQMEGIYFPITMKEFGARTYFKELSEGEHEIDGVKVQAHFLSHPGQTLGYRIWSGDKSIAYITDNELFLESDNPKGDPHRQKKLVEFLENVDVLIHDASFTDEEYKTRVGWGHPPISALVQLAVDAKVKELSLFHHEPDHNDADVDKMLDTCREKIEKMGSSMKCSAAMEGEQIFF
jgi:phosphoribosyl 1,2-cyclic phosphodiesterase